MDKRRLKVEFDHAQSRVKRPRIAFTLKGEDFLDGTLVGTWVNPISGKLQPIPNSEEADFQTSNAGRFAKLQISDGATINGNASGSFVMMAAGTMHADSGIKFTDCENTLGIGFITTAVQAAETGFTALVYQYDSGTDQNAVLIELFWANAADLTGGGVGIKVFVDGRVEIYKDDPTKPVFRGSFSGGGYNPGSVRGGSYERPSDQFVMIRVESHQGRFITMTSSMGGVCQFLAPWAVTTYHDDGTVDVAAGPVLPAKKWGWYQPTGGGLVVAAPVIYGYESPYAVSPEYQLSESPGAAVDGFDVLTSRPIPASGAVAISLLKPDGVTAFDRTDGTRICRVKVAFSGLAIVSGVTGAYPRIAIDWPEGDGDPIDVTNWVIACPLALDDGPQGLTADLELAMSIEIDGAQVANPVPLLTEVEMRPIRISLQPHPDDPDAPTAIVLLDGVGGVPEWQDGIEAAATSVKIKVSDRMVLVHEAQCDTPTPMDGLALCRPIGDGESIVSICLREGGLKNAEIVLPDLAFTIEDTPGQHGGEWNFCAEVGDLWSDVLDRAMAMAPQVIWGLKPTTGGTQFYAIDPLDTDPVAATFYRLPADALSDPDYVATELGGWAMLYGEGHHRAKLPKEGNVVRVTGQEPGTGKGIQAFIVDSDSRDPTATLTAGKLGVNRTVAYGDPALSTQAMVNAVAQKLDLAISKREYLHTWPAIFRFTSSGEPIWRGERIKLKSSTPAGEDETIRISAFTIDLVDESGGGLMDGTGGLAPASLRVADYTGGAIIGLGGSSLAEIRTRQINNVANGGKRRRGFFGIASTSMQVSQKVPAL